MEGAGRTLAWQTGHQSARCSHRTRHSPWNVCPHLGAQFLPSLSTLVSCPCPVSSKRDAGGAQGLPSKQMEQVQSGSSPDVGAGKRVRTARKHATVLRAEVRMAESRRRSAVVEKKARTREKDRPWRT